MFLLSLLLAPLLALLPLLFPLAIPGRIVPKGAADCEEVSACLRRFRFRLRVSPSFGVRFLSIRRGRRGCGDCWEARNNAHRGGGDTDGDNGDVLVPCGRTAVLRWWRDIGGGSCRAGSNARALLGGPRHWQQVIPIVQVVMATTSFMVERRLLLLQLLLLSRPRWLWHWQGDGTPEPSRCSFIVLSVSCSIVVALSSVRVEACRLCLCRQVPTRKKRSCCVVLRRVSFRCTTELKEEERLMVVTTILDPPNNY